MEDDERQKKVREGVYIDNAKRIFHGRALVAVNCHLFVVICGGQAAYEIQIDS